MSMILDALARAQRERDQEAGARHSGLSFQEKEAVNSNKRAVFLWIVVGALLVNALVISIFVLVRPWNEGRDADMAEVDVADNRNAPVADAKARPSSDTQLSQTATVASPNSVSSSDSMAVVEKGEVENLSEQMVVSRSETTLVDPPKIVKKPMLSSVSDSATVTASTNSGDGDVGMKRSQDDYVRLNDLSPNEKSSYSQYEINVHVYDQNPAKSFVLINMVRLHNGDRIPGGPVIDRITPQGVVLAQNGRKVLIERN